MRNQHLTGPPLAAAGAAVHWFGAVQSQDYPGAKWALAQRLGDATDAELDRAFDEGSILRTHVMRPTWHFVAPEDIRWLQELTAPRVNAASAYYFRQAGLDDALLARCNQAIAGALRGGQHLTRSELGRALRSIGVEAAGLRLTYIVLRAEVDSVICSGPRRGKQFTYALLEERAPGARRLERDEALAELAGRYFGSHGPAQAQDFAWWSGLTISDCRKAAALAGAGLASETIGGKTYWHAPASANPPPPPRVLLLPNYDEYLVAYRDRGDYFDGAVGSALANSVVFDGRVTGGWRRRIERGSVAIEVEVPDPGDATLRAGLEAAAERYQRFIELPVTLAVGS